MTEPDKKSVVIRVDGSQTIGMGHVMRCIGLAQEFRKRNYHVLFVLGLETAAVIQRLKFERFEYRLLGTDPATEADLQSTIEVVRQRNASLVCVDGYTYQGDWLQSLGNEKASVMLWTDYVQSESLPVDFILDQTPQADLNDYRRACPKGKIFTGLKYCVLREEFLNNHELRHQRYSCNELLITMGGSDPSGMTKKVLSALRANDSAFKTKVIVGPANPDLDEIKSFSRTLKDCEVFSSVSNMSELIRTADIAISAAGITLWEFAYSGLPTIAISVAENQKKLSKSLPLFGGGVDLGDAEFIECDQIWEALCGLSQNKNALELASKNMMRQVDGLGASRVVDRLEAT